MICTILVSRIACIQILSSFLFLGKEELHLGEALFYKRMHGLKQKIYRWKQYNVKTTYTYYWNRYNVVTTTTYKWNKYNRVSTTKYTWNKYNRDSLIVSYRNNAYVPVPTSPNAYVYDAYESYRFSSGYFSPVGASLGKITDLLSKANGKYAIQYGQNMYKLGTCEWNTVYKEYRYNGTTEYDVNLDAVNMHGTTTLYSDEKGDLIGTVTSTSSTEYPNGGIQSGYYYDNRTSSIEYSKGSTYYGQVTSTSSSAYPSNGYSGSYWYVSAGSDTSYSKGSTQYSDVSSTNSSAYPDNGKSGSYWYVYSRSTTSYSQGSYIGDKLSTNRNEYPDNGKSGSYWYVFDGEA